MQAKDELGRFGEDLAARHLSRVGMVVLDRNWRCRAGEIDIVAREGATLVVCEVKTRSSDAFGGPYAGITDRKLARLRCLTRRWVDTNLGGRVPGAMRIDVIAVWAGTGPARLEHLRGVG